MPELKLSLNGKYYEAAYCEYGTGEELMLVYHGFGQKKEDYDTLTHLYPDYKIVVFDLFDHGESSSVKKWDDLVDLYLLTFDELLKVKRVSRVAVLGFSIGTRVSTIISSNRVEQVEKLTLVAPDVSPEPLMFRVVMGTFLRFGFYFLVHFHWLTLPILFLVKIVLGSPFTFFYRLWKQKKYRVRIMNIWSGLRNSRKHIDWDVVATRLNVYVLRDEDILDNKKIRSFYEGIGVKVEALALSHYAFPKDLINTADEKMD